MFKKQKTTPAGRVRSVQPAPRGPVFSYHANRSVRVGSTARNEEPISSDPLRRRPRFSWIRRLPTIAALLALVVIAVFCLQLSSNAKVVPLGTTEGQVFLRDRNVYEQAVQDSFRSLLNGNKLTVDAAKISDNLKRKFPELKEVSVALPIVGNRPVVYIQPAIPQLIMVAKGGMYVLDSSGRALITGNQVLKLEELKIPVVNDESSVTIQVGRVALPQKTVSFITEVVGQLRSKGLAIASMTLPPGTNELHVRLDGVGYFVKFNVHGPAREEAGAFIAVKERLEAEHKPPQEYIDVRVENKAYFK